MTSMRMRSRSRTRADDTSRYGRFGVPESSEEERDFPSSLSRLARQEATSNRLANPAATSSRAQQSRLPQVPATRRPSAASSIRQAPGGDDSSWSTVTSATARTNTVGVQEKEILSSQPRSMLRRKPTGISRIAVAAESRPHQEVTKQRSSSAATRSDSSVRYGYPTLRTDSDKPRPSFESSSDLEGSNYRVYPELDRYRGIEPVSRARDGIAPDSLHPLATDLPPPTPLFSGASSQSQLSTFSASPSTRWSESPGPGPYSRDTTPTSMSSQSPGLVAPMRLPASKIGRASPADSRPPVTRRRAGSTSKEAESFGSESSGLAAVREVASSSSNSTVRTDDRAEQVKRKEPQSSAPPTTAQRQPQRLQKVQKDNGSPSKISRTPAKNIMRSPSPVRSRRPSQDQGSSTLTSPQSRPGMPSRPSRDGTPDLYSQFGGPMPVIHSNLSTSNVSERRQSGQLLPSSLPRSAASSTERLAPLKVAASNATSQTQSTNQTRSTRTPSPSVPSFRSRFPIFGRKKASGEDVQPTKVEKPARKGPAAGTGHEGYGRLGAVKRRSSGGAPSPRGTTGPVSSSENLATTDTFLLERLNPVIISGGEIVENRNNSTEIFRAETGTNAQMRRPSVDQRKGSSASISSRDEFRSGLAPSPLPRAVGKGRRPSDSSDSEAVSMQSTLAFRRSVQRTGSPDKAAVKIPKPIVTRGFKSPSINSVDTTILSDDSFSMVASGLGNTTMASSDGPKKLTKKVKSPRKWGIFGRSQGSSSKETKTTEKPSVPAIQPVNRPVAFYTILDSSEQEDNDEKPMQAILAEAEVFKAKELIRDVVETRPSVDSNAESIRVATADLMQDRKPSVSEQQPHQFAPLQVQSPPAPLRTTQEPMSLQPQPAATAPKPKSSRLPQVGRIPKVITSRPEQTSPKSFSRPFHRLSQRLQVPEITTSSIETSVQNESKPKKLVTPEATCDDATDFECSEDENINEDITISNPQFIAFSPPRKDSESTTCTSNSSYLNHTAITPQPSAPLQEDEIWDEYNDFIGEPPASATSSCGTPFHLERYESHLVRKRSAKTAESPTIKFQPSKELQLPKIVRDSIENGPAWTASSHYSADMTARINAAFRFDTDVPPPSTPFSVTKFVSGYGDRNLSPQDGACAASATTDEVTKPQPASPSPEKTASESEVNNSTSRNSANSTNSSRSSQESPLSQVNLRVGSMTVSKWLTFGQVLFSPVRDDLVNAVGSLKRHAILVIDGLGNDDWSFYAAETYPAATFFNLSPRAPIAKEQTSSSFPLSPPNHHQIQYNSHLEKFPFGPDTFTCVVFRFPAAAPEAHFRNIISETRRVLKPGGYIELSILDADLNNVGSRTRRAARRLKEQVAAKHPDYSLGSTSDMMLRLLGRKGFVDVKTCRVGVPVASAVANAQVGERGKKDERSLAEMMRDETEKGDENITKMVSKVGRWWYNRCYEASTTSKSVWSDKAVLAECEQWGTSLKLMVCHARMPEGNGRHASL